MINTNSLIYINKIHYITFTISYILYRGYRATSSFINIFILIFILKTFNYTKNAYKSCYDCKAWLNRWLNLVEF